jgi:hypothetical protein
MGPAAKSCLQMEYDITLHQRCSYKLHQSKCSGNAEALIIFLKAVEKTESTLDDTSTKEKHISKAHNNY